MSRALLAVLLAITVAGCSPSVPGAATTSSTPTSSGTSSIPTNSGGRAHITFDPCKDVPAGVIAQLQLDDGTPRPDTQTDGEIENVFCKYHSRGSYYLTIAASNYTLDMLKNAGNLWGFQELQIGGRPALFGYRTPEPNKESCSLNIAASTGVYGVLVGTGRDSFSPFPDCLTAARTNAETLVAYFPQ
ncbi:DUF3558 domain-containing protein [Mycobacteroides franklinii]|uniref:DUF3558 domain-containing protein n=1 Tax=Mycobacteroides franklinii TaxID=948102 RepID=UPI0009F54C27|nr:DUF3558 domain-containing protein [Mycobacteroides franklinii]